MQNKQLNFTIGSGMLTAAIFPSTEVWISTWNTLFNSRHLRKEIDISLLVGLTTILKHYVKGIDRGAYGRDVCVDRVTSYYGSICIVELERKCRMAAVHPSSSNIHDKNLNTGHTSRTVSSCCKPGKR